MPPEGRQRYEAQVRALAAFGHRGSASAREARAAEHLAAAARERGLAPAILRFRGCRSFGALLLLHVLVAAAGAALLWTAPLVTAVLGLLALASLLSEESAVPPMLGSLLRRAPSANVEARVPASGEPRARIVIVAHYDTQRAGFMWDDRLVARVGPRLARSPGPLKAPLFPVVAAIALQVVAGFVALARPALALPGVAAVIALVIYAIAALVLLDWAKGPYVEGANDNATGAAALLALLDEWRRSPVAGVELVALWTGCEETGLTGAATWVEAHRDEVRAVPTAFLNLDTLGRGRPRFLGVEYSIGALPVRYPAPIVELCAAAAAEMGLEDAGPKTISVATDGLPFLARGVPGACVVCFEDDGRMPGCHQLIDTVDRLDFDVAWRAVELGWAILRRLAAAGVTEGERGAASHV